MKNKYFIPIVLVIIAIVMTILYFCKLEFIYYLFGGLIGLLTHMLMLIENRSMYNTISTDIGRATFHPKKSSILWYLLRFLVVIGCIVLIAFLADLKNNPHRLQIVILLICGYLTVKILFILNLVFLKEGERWWYF